MTKTVFTQNDVYTPAEANAFHKGHENALIAQFDGSDPKPEDFDFNAKETAAYKEGFEAGRAKFGGMVYSTPALAGS